MNAYELQEIAQIGCLLLIFWELIKRNWKGAIFSVIAELVLVNATHAAVVAISIVLLLPVVFEEKWNSRTKKDWVRAGLAALVIATILARIIVF